MGPDHRDLMHGLRLAAIALVSAVVTATLMIGVGGALIERSATSPALIQASLN